MLSAAFKTTATFYYSALLYYLMRSFILSRQDFEKLNIVAI